MKYLSGFYSLLIFVSLTIQAQTSVEGLNAHRFCIVQDKDTVEYIAVCTDLHTPKPAIIFCQGSLPIPLIICSSSGHYFFPWANWNYLKTIEEFNIVVVSKSSIPLIAHENELSSQFCYITDKNNNFSFPQKYLENDNLGKYVDRNNIVISDLLQQKWIDKQHLVIAGHSQGANVALQTAKENQDRICALGYFSGNINGRFAEFIHKERNAVKDGFESEEQAQINIENLYKQWQKICREEISDDLHINVSRFQKDFSRSFYETITKLSIPVYIAYGTQDIISSGCDFLPVYFEIERKTNYKINPYIKLGHNFEEIIGGQSDFSKLHWDKVFDEFLEWLKTNDN
jgi:hypothetical protein